MMCKFEIVIIPIITITTVIIVIVRVYSTSLEDRTDDQKFLEKLNFIEIDDSLTSIDDLDVFDKMNEEKTPQRKFDYLLQFHNHQISKMNADNLIPFIINQIVIYKPNYFVSNVRYLVLFPCCLFL